MRLFQKRGFLNQEGNGGMAAYIIEVHAAWQDDEERERKEPRTAGEFNITITDCSNQINLHGDLRAKGGRSRALYKIRALRDSLSELEKFVESVEIVESKNNYEL